MLFGAERRRRLGQAGRAAARLLDLGYRHRGERWLRAWCRAGVARGWHVRADVNPFKLRSNTGHVVVTRSVTYSIQPRVRAGHLVRPRRRPEPLRTQRGGGRAGTGAARRRRRRRHSDARVRRVPDDVRDHHAGAAHGRNGGQAAPLGWVVVLVFWSILVYPVIAHWLFDPDGWLAEARRAGLGGRHRRACGAGAAALAVLAVVGRRSGWPTTRSIPHSIPLDGVGGGILWFGWFGFNAGGALKANEVAAQALLNTQVAGPAAWRRGSCARSSARSVRR